MQEMVEFYLVGKIYPQLELCQISTQRFPIPNKEVTFDYPTQRYFMKHYHRVYPNSIQKKYTQTFFSWNDFKHHLGFSQDLQITIIPYKEKQIYKEVDVYNLSNFNPVM